MVGAEASGLYGKPIEEFSRFWIQAGSHVLFVIDRIKSSEPVTTIWNWLLNNRDGETQVFTPQLNQITMYRGSAGLKVFHGGDAKMSGPVYSYVHDAYHPEPNQVGEGKPGSGLLYRFTEKQPNTSRIVVHAFAFDAYGALNTWEFTGHTTTYQLSNGNETWQIETNNGYALQVEITDKHQKKWQLQEAEKEFTFIS